MQACVDWVLITFGTQVINKKRPVRPVFPDYLSVSYEYANTNGVTAITFGCITGRYSFTKIHGLASSVTLLA